MEESCLRDPDVFPDTAVLKEHLGKRVELWDAFTAGLAVDHPTLSLEWKYYRDGKSWLGKVTGKKKVMCWIMIVPSAFRVTFYFGSKNDTAVEQSRISRAAREAFAAGAGSSKFHALSIVVRSRAALRDAQELVSLKERLT